MDQGSREVQAGYKPELKTLGKRIQDYDIIAVGTPTWWYTMAPAVRAFLSAQDWTGKVVIPFQTHGGWPGHALQDMEALCGGAAFTHEMAVQFDSTGGDRMVTSENEVERWANACKEVL